MDRVSSFLASAVVADIRKTHGDTLVMRARDREISKLGRIPTGIFFLDYALGGGIPAGRQTIIWGGKSTGKTVVCLKVLANAQKLCANCHTETVDVKTGEVGCECGKFREHVCVYMDVEGTWDDQWAVLHGIDLNKLILSQPEYAEQALDMGEAFLRSGEVDFIVFDSLAFLAPAKELEESVSKDLMAEQARIVGRGIRKFVSALNYVGNTASRRPTLIFTNQTRSQLGVFNSPDIQPGGRAPGFAATSEVRTFAATYEMDKHSGRPLYVELGFRVDKNKSFDAKIEGRWRLLLTATDTQPKGAVYEELLMVNKALELGLVSRDEKKTKWIYLDKQYKTKRAIIDQMLADPQFKKSFSKSLLTILGVH